MGKREQDENRSQDPSTKASVDQEALNTEIDPEVVSQKESNFLVLLEKKAPKMRWEDAKLPTPQKTLVKPQAASPLTKKETR